MAAFFAKIQYDNPKNPNNGGDNSKLGVRDTKNVNRQKDFFPESAMKNVSTKFFGDKEISVPSGESPRAVLAKWLTSPTNPYFAKAMVNRTWAQLFGNGFVDPIDDLIAKNKPSHPELFDELASHFARTGFDVKYLIKAICLSDTYQRSAKPTEGNKDDVELFSHMNVKVMTPEQLFDSLYQIIPAVNDRQAARNKAMQMRGGPVTARDRFVTFFLAGAEEANQAEYEPGIPQALQLMNSRIIGNPAAVRAFMTSGSKPADVIEKMYLATLSRRPTAEETKRLEDYVRSASTPAEAYSDILWAVVNSSEFTLIR
jgi:hypothetical protein